MGNNKLTILAAVILFSFCNEGTPGVEGDVDTSVGYCTIEESGDQGKCMELYKEKESGSLKSMCTNPEDNTEFPTTVNDSCPLDFQVSRCFFDGSFGTGVAYYNENIADDEAMANCVYLGGTEVELIEH